MKHATSTPRLGLRKAATLAGLAAGFACAASSAQMALEDPDSAATQIVRPPKVEPPGRPPILAYYLVVFALGGAVVYAAVMPSKRTHQD